MHSSSISKDLKARIPVLFHLHHHSVQKICELLGIKKTTVYTVLRNHRSFGSITDPRSRHSGRHRILSHSDLAFVRTLISRNPSIYLDEIQTNLLHHRQVRISTSTLSRSLQRQSYSLKSISNQALERNDLLRAAFMNRIGAEAPDMEMVIFIDESAKDDRTDGRRTGWSLIGSRCVQRRRFLRGHRYSILPALSLDGIIAFDIIQGSVTADRFVQFLRDMVVCDTIGISLIFGLLIFALAPAH
jgi:transposase